MNISIIGTGYVGLITGLCLSEKGHKVIAYDTDYKKIEEINSGKSLIYEKGLKKLLSTNLKKNFHATQNLSFAIEKSEISFVTVPTPFKNKSFDLSYIKQAVKNVSKILYKKNSYHLIVIKSTVIPTTVEKILIPIIQKYFKKEIFRDFGVAYNPEFLREGSGIYDFMNPDRLVIGSLDNKSKKILKKIYQPFSFDNILTTNISTAEMIKYTSNSFFANLISFSNEIANLSSRIKGINSQSVMKGLITDKRFYIKKSGKIIFPSLISYLASGPGFGGSCFPKDVNSIVQFGKSKGLKMNLLESVIKINNTQHLEIIKILKNKINNFYGLKLSILGLSFKPETDDTRESPSFKLIYDVKKYCKIIKVFDPVATLNKDLINNNKITVCINLEDSLKDVDVVIIMTNWKIFKNITKYLSLNKKVIVFDTRRMFKKNQFYNYLTIGDSN